MTALRKRLRVAPAYLTVAAVLFAATPHFHCVCPNGRVKPFCLTIFSGAAGCCCGGSCCPSKQGGPCCQSCRGPSTGAGIENAECCGQGSHAHLHGTGCTKTPTDGELLALASARAIDREDQASDLGLLVPAPPGLVPFAPFVAHRLSWESYQLPPPTDLVIALQHFLI